MRLNQSRRPHIGDGYGLRRDYVDQSGDGIMDIARNIYKKSKSLFGKASDLYSSEAGTIIKNMMPSSDENARPAYAGEKHAILKLANGKYGTANYMGPGTHVLERLKRGDPARTDSDRVAMAHDIRYALASGVKSKENQAKLIREADQKMVSALDRASRNKTDDPKNIFMGKRLIQAKMMGENAGVIPKGSFGGDLKNISDSDKMLLMSKAAGLAHQGYGLPPGQALKRKLVRQMRNKKKHKKMKGGFLSLLAPLLGTLARSVGTTLLGGVLGKVLGGGSISSLARSASKVMKSQGVKTIAQLIGKFTHSDLPPQVVDTAGKALWEIHKLSNNKIQRDKVMGVAKMLLPHVKMAINHKMKGSGLSPAGGSLKTPDSKILKLVQRDINKMY